MEPLEFIEKLAERARQESSPQTDVHINHLLQACRKESSVPNTMAWPAALSAIAACILLALALHTNTQKTDTVSPLFAPLQVELP